MTLRYILDKDNNPVACDDLEKWARFMGYHPRLAFDKLMTAEISTVFLGINHSLHPTAPPILWETKVFGGKLDGETARYDSEAAARVGHIQMVDRVRRAG